MISRIKFNLNNVLYFSAAIALIFVAAFFFWWYKEISIENKLDTKIVQDNSPRSYISGIPCKNIQRRPVAVMLSSDPIARPLSGVGQADIVFEMPVTPSGVTRMMAVYQCEDPSEIGSVRSAREDFIPLVAGLGAVYAYWGGEKVALSQLNAHIVDNIDAMKYEKVYFHRKSGIQQPHNGFTNFTKLWQAVGDLKYSPDNLFTGYPHSQKELVKNINNLADNVSIAYPYPFDVIWVYDLNNNVYKRIRGGQAEIDKNIDQQVTVAVVVVMKTTSKFTNKDYLNVNTVGSGDATIYQNGIRIDGSWEKDPNLLGSKLYFYNSAGQEIQFIPGKIWVEIVTKD